MSLDAGRSADVVTSQGGMGHPIQNLVCMWILVTLNTPIDYEKIYYSDNEVLWKGRECFQSDPKMV